MREAVKGLARASRMPSLYLALGAGMAGMGAIFDTTSVLLALAAIMLGVVGLAVGISVGLWRRPFLRVGRVSEVLETFALVRSVPGRRGPWPAMEVKVRRSRLRSANVHFRAKGQRLSNPIPWGLVRQGLNKLVILSGPVSSKGSSPHLGLLLAVNGTALTPPVGPPVWLRWEEEKTPPGKTPGRVRPLRQTYAASPVLRSFLIFAVVVVSATLLVLGSDALALPSPAPHPLSGADLQKGGLAYALGQDRHTMGRTPSNSYCQSTTCDGLVIGDLTLNSTDGIQVGTDVCGVDPTQQSILYPPYGPGLPDVPCPTSGWNAGDEIYAEVITWAGNPYGGGTFYINWGDGSTYAGDVSGATHVYSNAGNYTVSGYDCSPGCDSPASVTVYINAGLAGAVAGIAGMGIGGAGVVPVAGGGPAPVGLGASASTAAAPYFPADFGSSDGLWEVGGWMDPYTIVDASAWQPAVNLPPPPIAASPLAWMPQLPPPSVQPVTEFGSDSLMIPSTSDGQVVNMAATISLQGGDPTQPFTYAWKTDDGGTYSITGGPESSITHWFQTPGTHTISVTVFQNGRIVLPTKVFVQSWGAA